MLVVITAITFSPCIFFFLQKDASSALAHSGAHLDLSAFSSPEVIIFVFFFLLFF